MKWLDSEVEILKNDYAEKGGVYVSEKLSRSSSACNQMALKLGLRCNGNSGLFKKGENPWNKGVKGLQLSKATQFKKGHQGTWKNGVNEPYVANDHGRAVMLIQIEGKRQPYARYLYKKEYGEIGANMVIIHLDGDHMNCEVSNLKAISRSENMARNQNSKKAAETRIENKRKRELYGKYGLLG